MFLFKKDFATISLNQRRSLLSLEWLRQPSSEELKETFIVSMDVARAYEVRFFFSNNSIGISTDLAAQRWVSSYMAAAFEQLKVERYARVLPRDAMQEVVTYKVFDEAQNLCPSNVLFNVFYDLKSAEEWLLQGVEQGSKPTRT
ncbi:hypothetical protein [Pontibacter actiniarum]|uniref:STAS/SEC14 domain-containing protein n=1 Tax=Pontibacter actiniarum TaxID=323450 RepID=A0A1X9YQ93_9BACT|nr:hypothetical protein [Pontibacter actiniarum]ARS35060.1 hypothetical protein CA264_06165 [Pontibacter actiniarum]